jgi:hypothetical protein
MVGNGLWTAILIGAGSLFAQQEPATAVPFVGCKSDGQVGPIDAPKGKSTQVNMTSEPAQQLAFYKAERGRGVLAPRGWHCFGAYGSGGDQLYISPTPIDTTKFLGGLTYQGPVIALVHTLASTSGMFSVAELVARVFPAYSQLPKSLMEQYPTMTPFTFGPYPKDTLTYKSKSIVEFHTPAQVDGLGTSAWVTKNVLAIDGVAIIIEPEFDSLLLSVRLPPGLAGLKSAIVSQVERDSRTSKAK